MDRLAQLLAVNEIGYLHWIAGDMVTFDTLAREVLEGAEAAGDRFVALQGLCALAHTTQLGGDVAGSLAILDRAIEIARTDGDLHVLSDEDSAVTFDGLREAGYLLLAVPVELGGLGGNLVQVCDQQRRLARRAPDLAMSLTAHLAWCGAASDRHRLGDPSLGGVLDRALAGDVVSSAGRRCDPVQEAWSQGLSVAVGLGVADRGQAELPVEFWAFGTWEVQNARIPAD